MTCSKCSNDFSNLTLGDIINALNEETKKLLNDEGDERKHKALMRECSKRNHSINKQIKDAKARGEKPIIADLDTLDL